ncbi:hypothetical protein SPLC1_S130860 [Arthrospira platensis C1]|nr:hypothetical protein SPLC1_S130860 [Arthrospira platensis C1]
MVNPQVIKIIRITRIKDLDKFRGFTDLIILGIQGVVI